MTHYMIIGNGVAGIEAAMTIRSRYKPAQARITVIGEETDYFFSRTALMYAFMDKMRRRELEPFERKSYTKQKIDLIRDRVVDVDDKARVVTLQGGKSLEYDKLLLAVGAGPRMFPWDGVDAIEEGLVHFVSMQDLDACERLVPSTDRAVVIGGGLIGIELVECLNFHGVDVTFLVREPYYWPMALNEQEGDLISEHIREHGVDLRHEEEMTRARVDSSGRVSGVETDKGDEISCQMLGICVGVISNSEWLDDTTTPPERGRGIKVDRGFKTSLDHVWAAGDCIEMDVGAERPLIETIWYSAKRHGQLAAQSMMGDPVHYEEPLFYNSSKFFEIEYTTVGQVANAPENTLSIYRKHPERSITQRIAFHPDDRRVIGFNMLGSRWNHTILERWIHQRRDVEFVLENLADAQFDVEFGRAKLADFHEEELPL